RGTSYYRLRQVDQDGRSETFRSASVVIDARYGVYPNPVSSAGFTLEQDEPNASVLHLYNASGVEMSINKSALSEASTQVKPLTKLASGVYILTVEERGTVRKHRLVVQ
ncbi:T9SS type A sorting domain-containing protein, partial [Spirosoma koreense]